jgi:hypothetical protein
MQMQRSNCGPPYWQPAMLAKMGEGFRKHYADFSEEIPDNLAVLLKRLDEKAREDRLGRDH